MTLRAFFLFLLFSSFGFFYGQSDSLREVTLLKKSSKAILGPAKIKSWIALGEFYEHRDISKADSLRKLVQPKLDSLSGIQQFQAMLFVSKMLELAGNYNDYFSFVRRFSNFQDDALNKKDAFAKNLNLGFYYASYLDHEKADQALKKALGFAKDLRSFSALSEVYSYLAFNKMLGSKKDQAIKFTEESINYARRSGYKRDLAKAFNFQAQVYDFFGQVELAVAKNLVAYQLASSDSDFELMAKFAREIGQKQLLINNLKDAEYYLTRSFEHAKQINDLRQMGLALGSKSEIRRKIGKYPSAIAENEGAIRYLEKVGDQNGLGEMFNNLGLVYKDLNAYPLAINHFNKALFYYENGVNREKIAEVYYNVATIFRKQKKHNKALTYLKRSLEIQQNFGNRAQVYITYREMSEIYKVLGNSAKAFEYLDYYVQFTDKNSSVQASRKIAELSEIYRAEQRDRLISSQADSLDKQMRDKELTETKLENISLRNNLQTYVIIGILILIILGTIIGVSRYNQANSRQRQKEAEMAQTLLRTQMNPHFIFNAMSVIQSYIYENDVKTSSKFLVNFSRLMRLILENSPKEFIPIEIECEILHKYLETQKLRFEERFDYVLNCPDELIYHKALIPPMITQPFIENAIEHGQLHTVENGKIEISFEKVGEMLQIYINDNGIGRIGAQNNSKGKDHKSMAMNITRERIQNMNLKYKVEGTLLIEDFDKISKTGTKVLISLPYRVELDEVGLNQEFA